MSSSILDKAALLGLFLPKTVEKDVPGVGSVLLRELSAPEVSDIRESCKAEGAKKSDFGFLLAIASVVDGDGQPMFSSDDLNSLRGAAQSRIGELVAAVMEVNGFHVKENAEKN